jgi:dTDP-L-rhamnose 4-epimerase
MVNVMGTTEMLDAFIRVNFRPEHLVLASSRAVYGEGEWTAAGVRFYPPMRSHNGLAQGMWDPRSLDGVPGSFLPSDAAVTKVAPSSVYAATKLAQEHICKAWCAAMGVPLTILRFQNVYGAGQSLTNPYTGVLTLFARLALTGEVIPVYEDGNITRDFVNVEDTVAALVAALSHRPDEVRTLDIGSGVPTTIHEVASLLASLAGAPPPAVTGEFRDGDIRAACCSPERARDEIGFVASRGLRDGLEGLLSWVQRHTAEEAPDTSHANHGHKAGRGSAAL